MKKEIDILRPRSAAAWRLWLAEHFERRDTVWVAVSKKNAAKPTLSQAEAVDEALCWGWIDGTARSLDEDYFLQSFSRRKPRSVWSAINKNKVARFIEEGRMQQPGLDSIAVAKANGYWSILDDVEALKIPPDLEDALKKKPEAYDAFMALSPSRKKQLLKTLALAQRAETREKRVQTIVEEMMKAI